MTVYIFITLYQKSFLERKILNWLGIKCEIIYFLQYNGLNKMGFGVELLSEVPLEITRGIDANIYKNCSYKKLFNFRVFVSESQYSK